MDYRALNKQTVKDAYPLPLVEVQDRLSGCTIFSTLDLQSGYWQLPVHPDDYEKTAFCPGPGLGLFQFQCMPFGLTAAPGSFQRLMNKNLSWVTICYNMHRRRVDSLNQQRNVQDPFRTGTSANQGGRPHS